MSGFWLRTVNDDSYGVLVHEVEDGGGDHHAAESAESHDGDLGCDPFWLRSTKDDRANLRWENKSEPSEARDPKRMPTRYEVF